MVYIDWKEPKSTIIYAVKPGDILLADEHAIATRTLRTNEPTHLPTIGYVIGNICQDQRFTIKGQQINGRKNETLVELLLPEHQYYKYVIDRIEEWCKKPYRESTRFTIIGKLRAATYEQSRTGEMQANLQRGFMHIPDHTVTTLRKTIDMKVQQELFPIQDVVKNL